MKGNFHFTFLNSSGWGNNQIDIKQIKRKTTQIYYMCTYKGLLRVWVLRTKQALEAFKLS